MASFLYFLPGVEDKARVPDLLRELGLGHALEAGSPTVNVQEGPAGRGALLWPPYGDTPTPGYYPEAQTWQGWGARLWVGWETARPPGPQDLARAELQDGYLIEMADGRKWQVPAARLLPTQLRFTPDLQGVETSLLPQYREFYNRVAELAARLRETGGDLGDLELLRVATEGLAVNYRIGPAEVSVLGLMTRAAAQRCVFALTDGPLIEAVPVTEKNSGTGPNTPSG